MLGHQVTHRSLFRKQFIAFDAPLGLAFRDKLASRCTQSNIQRREKIARGLDTEKEVERNNQKANSTDYNTLPSLLLLPCLAEKATLYAGDQHLNRQGEEDLDGHSSSPAW